MGHPGRHEIPVMRRATLGEMDCVVDRYRLVGSSTAPRGVGITIRCVAVVAEAGGIRRARVGCVGAERPIVVHDPPTIAIAATPIPVRRLIVVRPMTPLWRVEAYSARIGSYTVGYGPGTATNTHGAHRVRPTTAPCCQLVP